jgi:two-component system sensor histidine kinase KdpD
VALLLERESLRRAGEEAALARRSDQLQRDLLASLSHELRTPLTAIRGAAHQLEAASPLAGEILKATERLDRLVGNLLSRARLESGQVEPKMEWGTVKDLVEGAQALLSTDQQARSLVVNLPEGLPLLKLDFPLAQQALANLLDNAFRYGPAQAPVALQVRRLDKAVEIRVQDQGPGVPEDLLPRLFGRFQRAAHASPGGSGLGLSIAKGFVEVQGGGLRLENRLGEGACFILTFPQSETPPSLPLT